MDENEDVVKLLFTPATQGEVCYVVQYRLIERPFIPPVSQERTNPTFYVLNQVQLLPTVALSTYFVTHHYKGTVTPQRHQNL